MLNAQQERFTDELAPRDVVARAISDEIEKGGEVFLDIRHLGEGYIDHELPQERKLAITYEGIDPVIDLIPIKPVAHYTMGGIDVDASCMTCVSGLYAAGEAANQKVHGANRLGGNSLLELIVFGRTAGKNAAAYAKENEIEGKNKEQLAKDTQYIEAVKAFSNEIDFYQRRESLGEIFYKSAGIKRTDKGLNEVLDAVRQAQGELSLMGPIDKSNVYNTNLVEFLEFTSIVELSEILLVGAISRKESRGAHYREDMPAKDDEVYAAHTISWKEKEALCLEFLV